MSQISAPYRFVPLSRLILLPSWANEVSHDQPFKDGLCGELTLRLTTYTALCVGGEQDKSSEREPGKVHFFRMPDQRPAIPGSSLKGMLRNVLEIASFARFRQVEDQRLGVRDISESDNFYCKKMVRDPSKAGWLSFSEGAWRIQPCTFSRLYQGDLIKHCGIELSTWKTLSMSKAKARYDKIGLCPPIRFEREPIPQKSGQSLARPDPNGALEGRIVVTGQPGKPFDEGMKSKKYEFIFHGEEATTLPIEADVMAGFRQIHDNSEEWSFWSEKLVKRQLPQGIPVFYHTEGNKVKSLGLALMYKLPYANSLHDAIRHTHKEHLGDTKPDLPDLIFGHLGEDKPDEEGRGGLRGRVNIGMAKLAGDTVPQPTWKQPCILNGPKPTFYPAYVRQDKKGSFRQLMENDSELSGWKRYPVKNESIQQPAAKSGPKVQVCLETLPADTAFTSTLRFHNLRRVELGALLWALDFGGRSQSHRHALGMGKPFGLGQVAISVDSQRLRSNDPGENLQGRETEYLHACRREFIDLMDQFVGETKHTTSWENSAPIKVLLEQALPSAGSGDLAYMPSPKEFVDLRRKKSLEELQETFHESAGITPDKGFNTSQSRGYDSHFADHIVEAGKEILRKNERDELARRTADAPPEAALLLEIESLLKIFLDSGTGKKGLADKLMAAYDTSMDMDAPQQKELRGLAEQCNKIVDKKIQHACKKILRDVLA